MVVLRVKLRALRLEGVISSLKVALSWVLVAATAPCAGTCCVTVGRVMSLLEPVTKAHVKLAGSAMPLASWAPVVTVAVHLVPAGKLAAGVNVATRLATS